MSFLHMKPILPSPLCILRISSRQTDSDCCGGTHIVPSLWLLANLDFHQPTEYCVAKHTNKRLDSFREEAKTKQSIS